MNIKELRQEFIRQAAIRRNELTAELQKCDLELSDIGHFIEFEKYDAIVMVKVAKKIKAVRGRRRAVKIELEQLQSMTDVVRKKDLEVFENKTYTYRTDIMKDIIDNK